MKTNHNGSVVSVFLTTAECDQLDKIVSLLNRKGRKANRSRAVAYALSVEYAVRCPAVDVENNNGHGANAKPS